MNENCRTEVRMIILKVKFSRVSKLKTEEGYKPGGLRCFLTPMLLFDLFFVFYILSRKTKHLYLF